MLEAKCWLFVPNSPKSLVSMNSMWLFTLLDVPKGTISPNSPSRFTILRPLRKRRLPRAGPAPRLRFVPQLIPETSEARSLPKQCVPKPGDFQSYSPEPGKRFADGSGLDNALRIEFRFR